MGIPESYCVVLSGGRRVGKTWKMFQQALTSVAKPGQRALIIRADGSEHGIRNVTPGKVDDESAAREDNRGDGGSDE